MPHNFLGALVWLAIASVGTPRQWERGRERSLAPKYWVNFGSRDEGLKGTGGGEWEESVDWGIDSGVGETYEA